MSRTFRDAVADYLKGNQGQWVDGMVLQQIGGCYAWRTRLSECRTKLGMVVENRQRRVRDHEPGCAALSAWDIEGACHCGRPATQVISEYRYVPEVKKYADLLQIAEAS